MGINYLVFAFGAFLVFATQGISSSKLSNTNPEVGLNNDAFPEISSRRDLDLKSYVSSITTYLNANLNFTLATNTNSFQKQLDRLNYEVVRYNTDAQESFAKVVYKYKTLFNNIYDKSSPSIKAQIDTCVGTNLTTIETTATTYVEDAKACFQYGVTQATAAFTDFPKSIEALREKVKTLETQVNACTDDVCVAKLSTYQAYALRDIIALETKCIIQNTSAAIGVYLKNMKYCYADQLDNLNEAANVALKAVQACVKSIPK